MLGAGTRTAEGKSGTQDRTGERGYRTLPAVVLWIRNYYYYFFDPDPALTLISDPDSDPDCL